jgi:hypothetical protein
MPYFIIRVIIMKKGFIILGIVIIIVSLLSLLLFTGCKNPKPVVNDTEPLFNESLNDEIQDLTQPETQVDDFEPFMFEWKQRNESKYEIAEDDIFTIGDFKSDEVSFFGVMLGDSFEQVIEFLGMPDVMFIPADESYRNLEYRKKIGIGGLESGLTFHLVNDTVTRVTVKPNFNKYLHGNTSIGTEKDMIYAVLDVPDYQNLVYVYRIFHYVEKGTEVYFKNRYVNRISFIPPKEFKGVEFVTETTISNEGILINTTNPVLVE